MLLLLALIPLTRDRETTSANLLSGNDIVLLEPVGDVTAVSQFRWQSHAFLDRYYVEVRDDDGVIHHATLPTTSFVVSAELQRKLVAGRYRWRVMARDATRAALVSARSQSFAITR